MNEKQMAEIEALFNQFRGVKFLEVKEEDGTYEFNYIAQCQFSLLWLISAESICACWTSVHCPGFDELEYITYCEASALPEFIKSLKYSLEEIDGVDEDMEKIDKFSSLNPESQKKYIDYIKHMRGKYVNGFGELSAAQLLHRQRHCFDCGKELCSKDDEIRTILEFDDPERAWEILEELTCEE